MKDNPRISAIVAISENLAMGKDNGLMFHLPGDLPRFKRITTGHPIIMGRKTFESKEINKRPLPGRLNIVITRDAVYDAKGATVVDSIEKAIALSSEADKNEIFIIGGAQIIKESLPKIDRLYLTVVKGEYPGDVYFPEYKDQFTKVIEKEDVDTEGYSFSFITLDR